MITEEQERDTLARAYVPEHLVNLMTLVSGGEPFLVDDYFCCRVGDLVIVVGYPLGGGFRADKLERLLHRVVEIFRPCEIAIVAPELPGHIGQGCSERESDVYYTLNLDRLQIGDPARRSVAKAMRLGFVERSTGLDSAHRALAEEFVERVNPPDRVKTLLFRMWEYVGRCEGALVVNVRGRDGLLAAFYVVDLTARDFSTYVIGCRSRRNYIPGASDLCFHEMIKASREAGKTYIHLGLGVNEGVRRFKEKWGGVPAIPYEMCRLAVRKPSLRNALAGWLAWR
ncbi:MAG: hypothetical protein LDL33_06285 [Desulfomonile sp.]|nr:hypothetical protein [Desulfomonile sp.]